MQVDHVRERRVGFDADTGEVRWTFQIPRPVNAVVTLTAVGLVFTVDLSECFHFPATFECTPDSAVTQFAQRADGLTIREQQIRKVERDSVAVRQFVERLTQLVDILCVESAADGQHRDRAVGRGLYPEHRPGCAERNYRSNRNPEDR